jgi:TQXA domain-containing protein
MRKLMSKTRWVTSLVVILVTIMGLLAMTVFASTAYLVGTASGGYVTHDNLPDDSMRAGTLEVTLDGGSETYEVYCADLGTDWCPPPLPNDHAQEQNLPPLDAHVVWILNNYYPHVAGQPDSGLDDDQRAAAVQLAIWHFTDDLDISSGSDPDEFPSDVFDAARAIITAAETNTASVPQTPTTLTLEPSSDNNLPGTSHMVTATLKDQNGQLLDGYVVEFEVTSGPNAGKSGSATTGSAGTGKATFTYTDTGSNGGVVDTITAEVDYTIPIGLRWTRSGCQDLIMAEEAPGQVSASAIKEWCVGSIGDYVWWDEDGEGDQNESPNRGINGVELELYLDDGDGVLGLEDTRVMTTTTQTNPGTGNPGYYKFDGLASGNYFVKLADSNFQSGGALYEFRALTIRNASGVPDTLDSDFYTDTHTTALVTLDACEEDLTIDAGVEYTGPPTVVTLSSFAAKASTGGLASLLWLGLVGLTVLAAGGSLWIRRQSRQGKIV